MPRLPLPPDRHEPVTEVDDAGKPVITLPFFQWFNAVYQFARGALNAILVQNSQTAAYALVLADAGRVIDTTAGVTIPTSIFAAGTVIWIYNNSAAGITLTQGTGLTLRLNGTATTGNRTLAQRGFAWVYFHSATEAIAGGGAVT